MKILPRFLTKNLLMRKLLELDGIKAEGEAKLQRKAEVMFMVLRVTDLKAYDKRFHFAQFTLL